MLSLAINVVYEGSDIVKQNTIPALAALFFLVVAEGIDRLIN